MHRAEAVEHLGDNLVFGRLLSVLDLLVADGRKHLADNFEGVMCTVEVLGGNLRGYGRHGHNVLDDCAQTLLCLLVLGIFLSGLGFDFRLGFGFLILDILLNPRGEFRQQHSHLAAVGVLATEL